jgi:DNA polymerase III epsilon subunit-like protein
MLTDIMVDLETLATTPDAAILTIGAVKFDPFGDEVNNPTATPFYARIDLDSCDRIGLITSEDTINWWAQQSKEAQEEAFGTEDRIDIVEAMNQFYKFCWGSKRVWSHGAGFDAVILETVFRRIQKACPWQYWAIRDTRTLFDMGIDARRPPVLKHHSLEDAWNQAVGVQNVCKELRNRGVEIFKDLRKI